MHKLKIKKIFLFYTFLFINIIKHKSSIQKKNFILLFYKKKS